MPVVEIVMSPIIPHFGSTTHAKLPQVSVWLLTWSWLRSSQATSLFQAHASWDKGRWEEFLIAGEFNCRPARRFLNLYFFPYFLALVSCFAVRFGANIYSLFVYLVVLLPQTSASNAQFVCVEARVRVVFPARIGYSLVVTFIFSPI